MATIHPPTAPVGSDTLITVKVIIEGTNRRFKLALRDLGAHTLPHKLRFLLAIPPEVDVKFERYSDSAGNYVLLDSDDPAIYKQLYRAAKAKLKLRLKATVTRPTRSQDSLDNLVDSQARKAAVEPEMTENNHTEARQSYLDTVLSSPTPTDGQAKPFGNFTHMPLVDQSIRVGGEAYTKEQTKPLVIFPARAGGMRNPTFQSFEGVFGIDCNHCHLSIPNEHYHCSICETGDFDICQACIDSGFYCNDEDHWLIKRFIRNGMVIPSITEKLPPRKLKSQDTATKSPKEESSAPTTPKTDERPFVGMIGCNCCITEMLPHNFVTCKDCYDFDLCLSCFKTGNHGHHPAHRFEPVDDGAEIFEPSIKALCAPGRGVHHEAACDGCDKPIVGVRHKCLSCPDWDFCSDCVAAASDNHPGHRFAPLYEPLEFVPVRKEVHRGIYCDGPLCSVRSRKVYIKGDRYKCTVCHDTDFCSNCEALPTLDHNRSHPLIKMKTALRHVSISTINETDNGRNMVQMGDRPLAKHAATETTPSTSTNAATQVQTVAEVKPAESGLAGNLTPQVREADKSIAPASDLQAWYQSDSTPDGSTFGPNRFVSQSWTLHNPGPNAWPVGCAVHYIGGDDMRNLDALHPSSVSAMTVANRSNALYYSLQPGETAVFTVLLKSPPREGRAISYWRLKTPEGLPFGHKLWVDINVRTSSAETTLVPAIPSPAPVAVEAPPEDQKSIPSTQSSTMIFPKLEKESPVSSVHNVAEESTAIASPMPDEEDHELLEDVESLELEDDDETDEDGFMTDEEYDILNASDEDFLEAQQVTSKK